MNDKKYTDWMKEAEKGFIDGIDTRTENGRTGLGMIYGFARKCFLESKEVGTVKKAK